MHKNEAERYRGLRVRSGKVSEWDLYLSSFSEMLPYFAAFDHSNYTRWGLIIFLADMKMLPKTAPEVQQAFESAVTKCCIYNQFSVAFILHSIKAYFFTCSYFRILYSVLHLKDSSTSMRAKLDDLNSIHTLVQLNISERLHSSNKKLSFQIT